MDARVLIVSGLTALLLTGCNTGHPEPVAVAAAPVPAAPAAPPSSPALAGPLLGPDGTCQGEAPAAATAIAPGIGECELLRLKGRPPTDVLVGESGRGHREVQVLYAEPGGRELYFFIDNRLDRIVR